MKLPRLPPKDIVRLLVLGLAVREVFSFWTGHSFDMEVWVRNGYYVGHGWNPYQLMPPAPGLSFTFVNQMIPSVSYLPLWSLLLAGLYNLYALVPGGGRFFLYFLLKQPSILGDVALGYAMHVAVRTWGGGVARSKRILLFWMTFPYAILISAVWGMFDALVAAVVLASLLASRPAVRSGLLGVAILLKTIPVVFLPTYFFRERGRARWIQVASLAIPIGFTGFVFLVTGWPLGAFSSTVSADAHGIPQGLSYGELLVSPFLYPLMPAPGVLIPILGYLWIPAVLLGAYWAHPRFVAGDPESVMQSLLFVTVIFFLTRWVVNEQYIVYLLAFLAVDIALWHPERRLLFRSLWLLTLVFVVTNNVLLVQFLAPVDPNALAFQDAVTNGAFGTLRFAILDAVALLFSVHLVQLGWLVVHPGRDPVPWLLRGFRALLPRKMPEASGSPPGP